MNDYLEKRNKLPDLLKQFLLSDTPRYEVERACFMYGLDETEISLVARPIALIFIGELKMKDYPATIAKTIPRSKDVICGIAYEINKRIFYPFSDYFQDAKSLLDFWGGMKSAPIISEEDAWQKVLEFEPEIMENKQAELREKNELENLEKERVALTERLPIEAAMKKYPEMGEQLVTGNHIRLKTFPEPVRPSVKNWLSDYMFNVGITNHDQIVRGNYLFRSQNGQTLSSEDREKLSLILKSFEEKTPLEINSKLKIVIFPIIQKPAEPKGDALPTSNFRIATIETGSAPRRTMAQNFSTAPRPDIAAAPKPAEQFFQNDRERLSAWRKDLAPQKPENSPTEPENEERPSSSQNSNIHFSSPQKFSTEKNDHTITSLPAKIAPISTWQDRSASKQRPLPKNVVNLKEHN